MRCQRTSTINLPKCPGSINGGTVKVKIATGVPGWSKDDEGWEAVPSDPRQLLGCKRTHTRHGSTWYMHRHKTSVSACFILVTTTTTLLFLYIQVWLFKLCLLCLWCSVTGWVHMKTEQTKSKTIKCSYGIMFYCWANYRVLFTVPWLIVSSSYPHILKKAN